VIPSRLLSAYQNRRPFAKLFKQGSQGCSGSWHAENQEQRTLIKDWLSHPVSPPISGYGMVPVSHHYRFRDPDSDPDCSCDLDFGLGKAGTKIMLCAMAACDCPGRLSNGS
jgi:hypothetical protein